MALARPILIYVILKLTVIHMIHGSSDSCLNEENDPCLSDNHIILNDSTRCIQYSDGYSSFLNDYTLESDWYRSVTPGCDVLATQSPQFGQCQAAQPMWLCDQLPIPVQEIVVRKICAVFMTNSSYRSYDICVKNCGQFTVYRLFTTNSPKERYCFANSSNVVTDKPEVMQTTEIFISSTTTTTKSSITTTKLMTTSTKSSQLPTTTTKTTSLPTTTTTKLSTKTIQLPTTTTETTSLPSTTITKVPTTITISNELSSTTTKKLPISTTTKVLSNTSLHKSTTGQVTTYSTNAPSVATIQYQKTIDADKTTHANPQAITNEKSNLVLFIVIGVLVVLLLFTMTLVFVCCCVRKRKRPPSTCKENVCEYVKENPSYVSANGLDFQGLYSDIDETGMYSTIDISSFTANGKTQHWVPKKENMYQLRPGVNVPHDKRIYEGLDRTKKERNIYQELS